MVAIDIFSPLNIRFLRIVFSEGNVQYLVPLGAFGAQSCPGARRAVDKFAESQSLQNVKLTSGQGVVFREPAKSK